MENHKIIFDQIKWDSPIKGMKQKVYDNGNSILRLIHFNAQFIELDWCQKAHIGYILEGEMTIQFKNHLEHYTKGDILDIPKGEAHQHKVILEKGKTVDLIVFENKE